MVVFFVCVFFFFFFFWCVCECVCVCLSVRLSVCLFVRFHLAILESTVQNREHWSINDTHTVNRSFCANQRGGVKRNPLGYTPLCTVAERLMKINDKTSFLLSEIVSTSNERYDRTGSHNVYWSIGQNGLTLRLLTYAYYCLSNVGIQACGGLGECVCCWEWCFNACKNSQQWSPRLWLIAFCVK